MATSPPFPQEEGDMNGGWAVWPFVAPSGRDVSCSFPDACPCPVLPWSVGRESTRGKAGPTLLPTALGLGLGTAKTVVVDC